MLKIKAVIEIPAGSVEKIEVKDGEVKVDRVIKNPFPEAYGFVPGTLAKDGDPDDIYVVSSQNLTTLQELTIKVKGKFECTDQGFQDDKLVGIPEDESISELDFFKRVVKIGDFLMNYKEGFKVLGYKTITKENI